MKQPSKSYLQIHFAVLLFGITAIIGKYIPLDERAIVWHRLWIAVLGLIILPGVISGIQNIPKKKLLIFIGIGFLVSLHWLTFYGSIKLANNASVTLACLTTSTFFTAILEPLITKSKFQKVELLLGVFVLVGMYFILQVDFSFQEAIFVGLISAFLASLFSVLNKKYISNYNSLSISAIELISGFFLISLLIPFYEGGFNDFSRYSLLGEHLVSEYALFGYHIHSFWFLIVLGLLCTSLAYALALSSLKHLSAFTSNLAVNLEPVYGILLAAVLFNESDKLGFEFYLGTSILLLGVVLHPILLKLANRGK